MRVIGPGHFLIAIAMVCLGVLSLVYGDFAMQWQPVPQGFPLRADLAYASGVFLLIAGSGILVKRIAVPCALALTVYWLFWMLLHLPGVVPDLPNVGAWLGVCEPLAISSGCWIVFATLAGDEGTAIRFVTGESGVRVARILFGAACLVFGLSHFVYADFTVGMIPAWLPHRLWFAYLTGAGHLAAGAAILFMVLPRLGATLEALMMSSFVLLVHVPSLVASPPLPWGPTPRIQLTFLFVALTLAASAWAVAGSLRLRPWGLGKSPPT